MGWLLQVLLNEVLQFRKGTFRITGEGSVVLSQTYGNRDMGRAFGLKTKPNKTGFCDQMRMQRLIFRPGKLVLICRDHHSSSTSV